MMKKTISFLLILLTAIVRLRLHEANGVSKVINLSSNAASLAVYLFSGNVLIPRPETERGEMTNFIR